MKYFALFIIALIKFILSSKEMSEKVLEIMLNSLPIVSITHFEFEYPNYIINITNLRFFKAITTTMLVTPQENSIEAKDIILTVACDLTINMERVYSYHDFLIQFQIEKMILSYDKQKHKYTLDALVLDNMFISSLHDVASSKTFSKFIGDAEGILGQMKKVLAEIFEGNLLHQNLYYYDLVKLLDQLKNELTQYEVSFPHYGRAVKQVTAKEYRIEKKPEADESDPKVLISRSTNFTFIYTVLDVNTGQIDYETEDGSFKCTKTEGKQFVASEFYWNVLSKKSGSHFYLEIVNMLFIEIAKKMEEKDQLVSEGYYNDILKDL